MAPQQPASGAGVRPMPRRSSTRAVAALVLGESPGCTQPSRISIWRAWRLPSGRTPASTGAGGILSASAPGTSGRKVWPSLSSALKRAGSTSALRSPKRRARSAGLRGTRRSISARPMSSSLWYSTPEGQVVSQLRQVRQRSRCSRVSSVTRWSSSRLSSISFIR